MAGPGGKLCGGMDANTLPQAGTIPREPEAGARSLSVRVIVLAVLLVFFADMWIRLACLITFVANIDNSVPAAPAMLGLLLVLGVNGLLRRFARRWELSRGEIATLYIMLLIAVPMASLGIIRPFLPSITALGYFAAPENEFASLAAHLPTWMAPQDAGVVRDYFEASATEAVPWAAWAVPLAAWSGLFICFFVALMSAASLLVPQWVDGDKLSFPLATFNAELVGVSEVGRGAGSFFRNPLMWVGFALSFTFNAFNVAQSINPGVRALGLSYDLGALFTESPWDSVRPLTFYYRPEHVGFGYLVPLEILASTWVLYLALKAFNIGGRITGYNPPGYPYLERQSLGGYFGMALVLLYMARGHLGRVLEALRGGSREVPGPLSPRLSAAGLLIGSAGFVVFCWAAGMRPALAVAFLVSMMLVAVTFTRIRGETGTPSILAFPFGQSKAVLLALTGTSYWVRNRDIASLTVLSVMNFLSRGYFPSMMAYQMENFELARRAQLRRDTIALAMVIAVVIGLWWGYYTHLEAFYKFGANVLEGGTTAGGYRTSLAVQEFNSLSSAVVAPSGPEREANVFFGFGMLVSIGLAMLRFRFLRFPLHPLGYCLASSYGYLLWAPFFTVYVVKAAIVRIGGAHLYRQLIPLFLGIAFGHFFTAGIVWGVVGALLPIDPARLLHIDVG